MMVPCVFGKRLSLGCGGGEGLKQRCSASFSTCARWTATSHMNMSASHRGRDFYTLRPFHSYMKYHGRSVDSPSGAPGMMYDFTLTQHYTRIDAKSLYIRTYMRRSAVSCSNEHGSLSTWRLDYPWKATLLSSLSWHIPGIRDVSCSD